ncbi:hypothetical protein SAMN02745664_10295 [Moraxella cuniculi DSM 21768]|uniref:Sel1 repeat-containing protein n=2 Tax=Moraxella cuniculi TaxID=34061 RepID=A0A1N7DTC8_9GAMM|nr:hypothetical protein [Moraxella cuniculi]OOS07448.1 hypothetical protein B0189_03255 [Moraxella cuniculi]SIR79038.1 hypothetical protein SAMN02745664_10295 [Moraxella cuniculi DSM 21768]VEG12640.1 Uncharacterised protein [Moraxella cuniculi]
MRASGKWLAGLALLSLSLLGYADSTVDTATNDGRFGQQIMTGEALSKNADRSGMLLLYCLDSSWYRLGAMFPEMSKQEKSERLIEVCQSYIDTYSVYNVLLAADYYGEPKSEQQAWQIIQDNRQRGDNQGEQEVHEMIRKYAQTLDDTPPNK